MSRHIPVAVFLFLFGLITACGGSSSSGSNPDPTPDPTPTCSSTQRTFNITNSTSQELWLGVTAGTISCLSDAGCPTNAPGLCVGASGTTAGACGCSSNADCGSIAQCNTSNSKCYWNLPNLTTAEMHMAAGTSSTICFPAPGSGETIQWSGNIFARTGCDSNGQNCKTGECGSSSGGTCPIGTGGNPPATLAEFTLSNQTSFTTTPGSDFYDISIINGVNVGISMAPVSGTYSATSGNAYSCATAGNTSAAGQLSACSWTFTPTVSGTDRTALLRDVSPTAFASTATCPGGGSPNSLGYCTCTADSACSSSGLVCGLATNASSGVQYTQVCGTAIGWWTADQLCGSTNGTSSALSPLGCSTTVTNSDSTTSTHTNLFICSGTQAASCYSSGASASCCGCATSASSSFRSSWPSILSPSFGGSDNGCYNNNTNWVSIAQPWIVFLKTACPTAYTYPYDDATSTFTCQGSSSTGAPNYNITFITTQ